MARVGSGPDPGPVRAGAGSGPGKGRGKGKCRVDGRCKERAGGKGKKTEVLVRLGIRHGVRVMVNVGGRVRGGAGAWVWGEGMG